MLEEVQQKLERANLPMIDAQLLAIASTTVLASGDFPQATDDWEAKSTVDKMWTNWKAHYRVTHMGHHRQLLAAGTTPTDHANIVTTSTTNNPDPITDATIARLDGYLDNLAAAATTKHMTMQQLIETNATLTSNVATITANLTALTIAYTLLALALGSNTPAPSTTNTPTVSTLSRWHKTLDPNGYCWSHGYKVIIGHNSATCNNRQEGHKEAVTHSNTMGGHTTNKPT